MTTIAGIEVAHWSRELRETMAISRGGFRERHHMFVRLASSDGHTGYGEAVGDWRRIYSALSPGLNAQCLLGADIPEPGDVWEFLLGGDVYYESLGSVWAAVSAIEMALWDIRAQEGGASVTETIRWEGPVAEARFPVYASNIYWDDPERMADVAVRTLQRGARAVKVHIGVADPVEELPRLKAVRRAIGPETPLMVDLNCGYTAAEAVKAGEIWADLDIAWLEEPVAPWDWKGLQSVAANIPMPVAVGENLGRLSEFEQAVASGAQILMPDAGRVGMTRCRGVDELCSTIGVTYSPHNYSSGLLLGATVALLGASANAGPLEIDLSGNALFDELWGPVDLDVHGRLVVQVDRGPGLIPPSARAIMDSLPWTGSGDLDRLST